MEKRPFGFPRAAVFFVSLTCSAYSVKLSYIVGANEKRVNGMNGNRKTTILMYISAALVAGVALSAFVLSFDAIRDLAELYGIRPNISWLVPLIVDMAMIAFSVSVVRAELAKERTAVLWSMILLFTAVSVLLNVEHSNTIPTEPIGNSRWLRPFVYALAPLALLASFESLMAQVRSAVKRGVILDSLAELKAHVAELNGKRTELENEIADLVETAEHEQARIERERERLIEQLDELREQVAERETEREIEQLDERLRPFVEYVTEHPEATYREIGEHIGRAPSTVGKYANELKTAGIVQKNGNGWEVLA